MAQFNAAKEDEKTVALILTQKTDMDADQIAALTSNLSDLMAVKAEKEIKLSGFGMTAAQIAEQLGRDVRSIHNAIYRIRNKLRSSGIGENK